MHFIEPLRGPRSSPYSPPGYLSPLVDPSTTYCISEPNILSRLVNLCSFIWSFKLLAIDLLGPVPIMPAHRSSVRHVVSGV